MLYEPIRTLVMLPCEPIRRPQFKLFDGDDPRDDSSGYKHSAVDECRSTSQRFSVNLGNIVKNSLKVTKTVSKKDAGTHLL